MYAEPGVGGNTCDEELCPGNIRNSSIATSSASSHSRWMLYCLLARGDVPGSLIAFAASSRTEASSCEEANFLSGENVGSQGTFASMPVLFAALRITVSDRAMYVVGMEEQTILPLVRR